MTPPGHGTAAAVLAALEIFCLTGHRSSKADAGALHAIKCCIENGRLTNNLERTRTHSPVCGTGLRCIAFNPEDSADTA